MNGRDPIFRLHALVKWQCEIDIPWFYRIFKVFSFNLVCIKKSFGIDFYVSVPSFAVNLSKDEHGSF